MYPIQSHGFCSLSQVSLCKRKQKCKPWCYMFYLAFQNDLPFQVRTELLLVPPLAAQMESNICQNMSLIFISYLAPVQHMVVFDTTASNLKWVIWFSRRTRNLSLISSKRSFSSTVTVPIPSGLKDIKFTTWYSCRTNADISFWSLYPTVPLTGHHKSDGDMSRRILTGFMAIKIFYCIKAPKTLCGDYNGHYWLLVFWQQVGQRLLCDACHL